MRSEYSVVMYLLVRFLHHLAAMMFYNVGTW